MCFANMVREELVGDFGQALTGAEIPSQSELVAPPAFFVDDGGQLRGGIGGEDGGEGGQPMGGNGLRGFGSLVG